MNKLAVVLDPRTCAVRAEQHSQTGDYNIDVTSIWILMSSILNPKQPLEHMEEGSKVGSNLEDPTTFVQFFLDIAGSSDSGELALTEIGEQSLNYLGGYISFVFKEKYPELGSKTSIITSAPISSWLSCLSHWRSHQSSY